MGNSRHIHGKFMWAVTRYALQRHLDLLISYHAVFKQWNVYMISVTILFKIILHFHTIGFTNTPVNVYAFRYPSETLYWNSLINELKKTIIMYALVETYMPDEPSYTQLLYNRHDKKYVLCIHKNLHWYCQFFQSDILSIVVVGIMLHCWNKCQWKPMLTEFSLFRWKWASKYRTFWPLWDASLGIFYFRTTVATSTSSSRRKARKYAASNP